MKGREKNRNEAKSVPTWLRGPDLNQRPSGYHFVPVAVVCRVLSPSAPFARTLGDTAHENSSPDCFHFTNPTSCARRSHNPVKKRQTVRFVAMWLRGPDLNQRPSGYEPDELPDCSTPRYKIIFVLPTPQTESGAGDRNRTGTGEKSHGILSPGRLPVPPLRRVGNSLQPT